MKKGQVYEGVIESVDFPNKGKIRLTEEDKIVVVKNGLVGQKVRFSVNKIRKEKAEGRILEVLERKRRQKFRHPVRILENVVDAHTRIFLTKNSSV